MEIGTASLAARIAKSFSHFHMQIRYRIAKTFTPKKREPRQDGGLYRLLSPSIICICICAVCLCGSSFAWFTASASVGTTAIQSPSYKLSCQINDETVALAEAGTDYTLTDGTGAITLTATGTSNATGYCSVQIGGSKTVYRTEQVSVGSTFTFTVNAASGTSVTLTPHWGSYSGSANLSNNGTIGTSSNSSSVESDAQTQNYSAPVEEPTFDSSPTVTADSTPTEDTVTASESASSASDADPTEETVAEQDTASDASATETPAEPVSGVEIDGN